MQLKEAMNQQDQEDFEKTLYALEYAAAGQRYEALLKLKYISASKPELIKEMLSYESMTICENALWLLSQIENPPRDVIPLLLELSETQLAAAMQEKLLHALKLFADDSTVQDIILRIESDSLFS